MPSTVARICVVDDEPEVLELVEDLLDADTGVEVEGFATQQTAAAALRVGGFSAAVLDLMGVDGFALLDEFAGQLPCIVLTGHALAPETLLRAIELGAKAYLPKDEIRSLPRVLRIILGAPPEFDLWSVWLHPRLDVLGLRKALDGHWDPADRRAIELAAQGGRTGDVIGDLREHGDGVVEIVHRDPPQNHYHAATLQMYVRLLERLARDDTVRAIVFSSGLPPEIPPQAVWALAHTPALRWLGKKPSRLLARALLRVVRPSLRRSVFFGAGMPLEATLDPAVLQAILEIGRDLFLTVYNFPKPYVTAVAGVCVAGAFEKILSSHYVVADTNATFSLPEFRLGFPPPAGIALLVGRVGVQRAFTIAAEAGLIPAKQALHLGVIDRLVPAGGARDEAVRLARRFAKHGTVAGLHLARQLAGFDLDAALQVSFEEWQRMIQTPFARSRVEAFFRRRKPTMPRC